MELKIYNQTGDLKLTVSPNTSSTVTEEVMGECAVSVGFTHSEFVMLDVNDYIDIEGVRYMIMAQYRPKQKNTQTYEYSVKFYAPIHQAENTLMLFTPDNEMTSEFAYDGGPREHLQLWIDNMNRIAGVNVWKIGTVITAENKVIEYKNVKCWDAAFGSNGIAAAFDTEMWADGYYINLCKAERGERVDLGYLQGLTSLQQEENGEVKFFTRLFPLGSTRNIDASKYGHARLQLPGGVQFVDKNVDIYGVKEEFEEEAFSGIYPKYIGTVQSVRTENLTNTEGRDYTVYYIKDAAISFNPNDYEIPEYTKMIAFQSGELAGRGDEKGNFQANWHEDTKEWEIINTYPDEESQIPGGLIIPKPGDTYIPWNFRMPDSYTEAAELEYLAAVNNYLDEYSFDTNKYSGQTDRNHIENNNIQLMIGLNVRLRSNIYFKDGYKDTRITKVVRQLNDLCQATVTCTDKIGEGWKKSVDNSINSLKYEVAKSLEQTIIDIIKTGDRRSPSDYNVLSSLRSLATFLRKDKSDTMPFLLTLLQGAVFGKDGFAEGLLGFGAKIDENGYGEMRGLKLWESLTVPQLNYNRVDIVIGDKWRSPGAGVIETVTPDTDAEGNTLPSGTATLKLEDGEIGAIDVDDINMGIWHFGDSRDATEDSDDGRGNFSFAGFTTAYWRITEVLDGNKKSFRYTLRPGYTTHPQPQMTFSCRGNFTNVNRQTSVYETRTYTRMLWKQNTWEIGKQNIALQYGDLTNLNIFGMQMEGYSIYLNSVYFTGTITQVKEDGTPVRTANDRTDWTPGGFADYYDRVSYEGGLWLCVAEDGTNTIPSKDDPAWLLQVKSGDSIKSYRRWLSAETPYAYGSIVPFAKRVFMAAKDTSRPPYPLLMDHEGNYITVTEDGGKTYHYIIIDYTQSEDWTLLLDISGIKDGEDGASISVRYSADKANWHDVFQEGDIWMQQKVGTGAWSAPMRIVGESGENGKDAQYQEFQFAVNTSLTEAPVTGWQDAPPSVASGQYLWMRTGIVVPPATEPVNWVAVRIGGEKGKKKKNGTDGTSIKNGGRWRTGKTVEPMTVVTMGGKAFLSKVATSNPPMGVLLDHEGNRLIQRDGSYILTGEINTAEYEILVENGADGKNAVTYEYIYRRDSSRPATPAYSQADNYIPSGWTSTSQGVDENNPYEYRSERKKSSEGLWSEWSTPVLVFSFGKQGLQGLSVRDSEWAVGVQYRNDADLKTNVEVRYLDVALVRNDATETGWDAYECIKTHVSSDSIRYDNKEYWKKFSTNVGAIFTSLIIAKNAKINFLTGNQLTIAHSVTGKPCLGLSGSAEGEKVRFWVGSETPDNAPIKILEDGTMKQGDGNFVLHSDNSGEIAKGTLSWNSKGEFDFTRLSRSPFSFAMSEIIPPLSPGEKTEQRYSLTNLWTKSINNNYLVNTDNEDWIYKLNLPNGIEFSGATIYIFNTADYPGSETKKYLSIYGIPDLWGGTYKLYGGYGVMMIGVGTQDEFIGWQRIGIL